MQLLTLKFAHNSQITTIIIVESAARSPLSNSRKVFGREDNLPTVT